jgi:phosphoribosylaminoimidazolecarboxamide formyltransferase / IMP cyclohydrolase
VTEPDEVGSGRRPIRRALVSVADKAGLGELVPALAANGVAIVSTGGTADLIETLGVPVTRVEQLTGFGECLDGRIKTLHPAVHAGLLADLTRPSHVDQLAQLGIEPFDLVVSNLYPFERTVASGAAPDECVEQIDIGGPAMVRAAAKNFATVAVVTSPRGYPVILAGLASGGLTLAQRRLLAAAAFADIAEYDLAIARWSAHRLVPPAELTAPGAACWPTFTGTTARLSTVLRYGENPHQAAALFLDRSLPPGLAGAQQLGGREMSYNNYLDADAAWRTCHDFSAPAVAIIKHANPCGIAVGVDIAQAHRKAHACDPVSAYGSVVAANRPVSLAMAGQLAGVFTEVLVAPSYADGVVETLRQKKKLRILLAPRWTPMPTEFRQISGGLLAQTADRIDAPGDDPGGWRLAAGDPVDPTRLADLAFAWRAVRSVRSNAILLASDGATVGVGMGQVNRVDAARLAVARAGGRVRDAVAASDAFFPFADGLQVLIEAGVRAVVQPGGSIRDDEVTGAAAAAGVALYLTGTRHFAH